MVFPPEAANFNPCNHLQAENTMRSPPPTHQAERFRQDHRYNQTDPRIGPSPTHESPGHANPGSAKQAPIPLATITTNPETRPDAANRPIRRTALPRLVRRSPLEKRQKRDSICCHVA